MLSTTKACLPLIGLAFALQGQAAQRRDEDIYFNPKRKKEKKKEKKKDDGQIHVPVAPPDRP